MIDQSSVDSQLIVANVWSTVNTSCMSQMYLDWVIIMWNCVQNYRYICTLANFHLHKTLLLLGIACLLFKRRELKIVQCLVGFHITILWNKVRYVFPPNIHCYVTIIWPYLVIPKDNHMKYYNVCLFVHLIISINTDVHLRDFLWIIKTHFNC